MAHVHDWDRGVRGTQVRPLISQDAPVIRVEAGPGTGKTFGLVRRVQRILHPQGHGAPGSQVLIVAFNRVIAKQLRAAVEEVLATSPHDGSPAIKTVHALCVEIIGEDVRLLLDHEREAMLYDVLFRHQGVADAYDYDEATQALKDHEAKIKDHPKLWQAVRDWLKRHDAELISQLPGLLLDRLKLGDFEGRSFRYVIVDEFQDLTPGEQALFIRLRADGGQMVVLGDSRQSIYAFRGNDRKGLAKLETLLNPVQGPILDLTMTECQRCPSDIVEAANRLMNLYDTTPMQPVNEAVSNIHVVHWETPESEADGMAGQIIENVRANPNDSHLAMVTRSRFGYLLRDAIAQADTGFAVDLTFSESLLKTWAAREAFLFFCLIADPDPPTWRGWFGYTNSADGKDYKSPKRNAPAYLQFLELCGDQITEAAVTELGREPRQRRRGGGGAVLWDRADRFVDCAATCGPQGSMIQLLSSTRSSTQNTGPRVRWMTKRLQRLIFKSSMPRLVR